jgi:hypothetical protein
MGTSASPSSFPSSPATLGGWQGGFGTTGLVSVVSVSFTNLRDGGRRPFGAFPGAEFHIDTDTSCCDLRICAVLQGMGVFA